MSKARQVFLLRIMIFTLSFIIAKPVLAEHHFQTTKKHQHSFKLSAREISWAIFHPFIAGKVFQLSKIALQTTDSLMSVGKISDLSGGSADAFKHAYWMATLTQNIGQKKAIRLGIIHEKVNYKSYTKGQSNQDSIASLMDLKNNEVGANISIKNSNVSNSKLIDKLLIAINAGELFMIKKDSLGNYLNCEGEIIDIKSRKNWGKGKCLISSFL